MSFYTERLKLSETILTIESKSLLEKIKDLIKSDETAKVEETDFWDELHDDIKAEVELSIIEADNGQFIPHEEVMKKYEKWIKK